MEATTFVSLISSQRRGLTQSGYMMLIYIAGPTSVSATLREAAKIDNRCMESLFVDKALSSRWCSSHPNLSIPITTAVMVWSNCHLTGLFSSGPLAAGGNVSSAVDQQDTAGRLDGPPTGGIRSVLFTALGIAVVVDQRKEVEA